MTVGKVQATPKSTNTPPKAATVKADLAVPKTISQTPQSNANLNSGLKSFSLKNLAQKVQEPKPVIQKKEEKVVVEEPIDLNWNDPFDQEKLNEVWRKFTRQHESSPRIHTIYKNYIPQHVGGSSLLMALRNNTQEYQLQKERSNILSFLRRSLRNAKINLKFEISQIEDKGPKKAFTVADKYKLMAEKNPALLEFKKQFNLDIE